MPPCMPGMPPMGPPIGGGPPIMPPMPGPMPPMTGATVGPADVTTPGAPDGAVLTAVLVTACDVAVVVETLVLPATFEHSNEKYHK